MSDRPVVGGVAEVKFIDFDVLVQAKVDTGAWSGAVHCTDITEKDGKLSYNLLGREDLRQVTDVYLMRPVKNASGQETERYIVPFQVEIAGERYKIEVGLNDRTTMQREMLLGRKFLIENNILVDVSLTVKDDYEAELYL